MFRRCGYANLQNFLRSAGAERLFFSFLRVPQVLNTYFFYFRLFRTR